MKKRIALVPLIPLLALALSASPSAPAPPPDSPEGGARYFFCAAFQMLKYGGMVTGRPDAVLVGAVGAGLACAYGW